MGTQCGMVCSKAGQEYAKEAGAVNELILEANTKVMAFVDQPFDPVLREHFPEGRDQWRVQRCV